MLALFGISVAYCIYMVVQEQIRRKNMLKKMTATDMLPYVRYSRASIIILCLTFLTMPVAIFSTTLLFMVGPVVLFALLFFNLTFVALGSSYIPTDELLDKEEENNETARAEQMKSPGEVGLGRQSKNSRIDAEALLQLSEERRKFIQQRLDEWCANLEYKDSSVNMLTLSRTVGISKHELSLFFDQCMRSTFRIWLSEIRFNAAKKMMLDYPDYSNDIISAECGFSARTYLYWVFKSKERCTPTEWREEHATSQRSD